MQVNGIKSYSTPHVAFGNEETTEKKGTKKAAAIAGISAAAVAAAAVATGLHGKKIAGDVEGNFAKKTLQYLTKGATDIYNKVKGKAVEIFENIKSRFSKDEEVRKKSAEETKEAFENISFDVVD